MKSSKELIDAAETASTASLATYSISIPFTVIIPGNVIPLEEYSTSAPFTTTACTFAASRAVANN